MNHVQNQKNRIKRIFLAVLLFFAFGCILAGGLLFNSSFVHAAENIGENDASLFLPTSYEEYLNLQSPVDAAFSDKHIAVADGKVLYLYSRTENKYIKTTIPEAVDSSAITKIGFANERLFLSVRGASNAFYEFDFDEQTLKKLTLNCSTFCIDGNTLYTANVGGDGTNFASYSISDLATTSSDPTAKDLGSLTERTTPSMTLLDGTLYCTVDDQVYYVDPSTSDKFNSNRSYYLSSSTLDNQDVKSACAYNGEFYYTAANGLYRASFSEADHSSEKAVCVLEGNQFGALTSYGGDLYCVYGKSVRRLFFPEENRAVFTDYEIGASSDSINRLSGATDIVRAGSLIVIADTENHRVTVYNTTEKKYSVLAPEIEDFSPSLVATDGTIIAVASKHTVYVYKHPQPYSTEYVLAGKYDVNSYNISGIACVYGVCYFVTDGKQYGKLEIEEMSTQPGSSSFTVQCTASVVRNTQNTPKALAADMYGTLYTKLEDGTILSFDEDQFTTSSMNGMKLEMDIPKDAKSLRADFEGNLYYLNTDGAIYRNGEETPFATIDGKDFVYSETDKKPTSFALGFEDDAVSFLFGDFIVTSHEGALGFPTFGRLSDAKDIARGGSLLVTADTGNKRVTVFDFQKRSFSVIQTDFSPTLVATDGSVIAAASGAMVYVCKELNANARFEEPVIADLGTIKGLACVNGTVYYITEYGYGKVEEEDKGLVSRLEGSLETLTADANGILYVVDSSGHVRYYYEDEFADPNVISGGDMELSLHLPVSSLRADREGNLYYLSENAIWKNGEKFVELENNSFVYGDEGSPVAFALDIENNEIYLLYGNHVVTINSGDFNDLPDRHSDNLGNRQDILLPDIRRERVKAPTVRRRSSK